MKNKVIALFLLVILIFTGLFVSLRFIAGGKEDVWICENGQWVAHGKPSDPRPSGSCGELIKNGNSPEEIVEAFYSWYLQYEGNVMSSGAYKTSDYLSEEFRTKVDGIIASFDKGGYDPFLCAQDKPSGFTVETDIVSEDKTTVTVNLVQNFSGNGRVVPVIVKEVVGEWKITDVNCQAVAQKVAQPNNPKTVVVYFNNSRRNQEPTECGIVFGTERIVPGTEDTIKAALEQLFMGPTQSEKEQGYTSFFSDKTRGILQSVRVEGRTAYVDLKDIRNIIPNASTSCGSQEFLAQVGETIKHYRTVDKVIYAINGDPETFYEWIQLGCSEENNNCDSTPFK
ncbi:MAG: GerMN domain-containing protein [Patescibacteria group bacterium]|jgi:spore germination protein GerM